jgi:hypothetical protein
MMWGSFIKFIMIRTQHQTHWQAQFPLGHQFRDSQLWVVLKHPKCSVWFEDKSFICISAMGSQTVSSYLLKCWQLIVP